MPFLGNIGQELDSLQVVEVLSALSGYLISLKYLGCSPSALVPVFRFALLIAGPPIPRSKKFNSGVLLVNIF